MRPWIPAWPPVPDDPSLPADDASHPAPPPTTGFAPTTSIFSSSMQAELRRLERVALGDDPLEGVAATMRLRERMLLRLGLGGEVARLAISPPEGTFVADTDWSRELPPLLGRARLVSAEPLPFDAPESRAGGGAGPPLPLSTLLWALALFGPRSTLLTLIEQPSRYRMAAHESTPLRAAGAIGSAMARLRQEPADLDEIARWPGMTPERASRLINALYLTSNLMVLRGRGGGGGGWLTRRARW